MGKVDLRPLFPPVRDQGPRGTCVAFSVTAAHELLLLKTKGTLEDLSEEILYWHCKQIDGDQLPGTSFDSAAIALMRNGQPLENQWPYDAFRNERDPGYIPPPIALDPNCCYKTQIQPAAATVDEIKKLLDDGRPVALGIPICDSFSLAPGGRVPMPALNEAFTERHAILIIGYDDGMKAGEEYLLFRNSWGDTWGDHGYGYLPYDYLKQHGGVAWIVKP